MIMLYLKRVGTMKNFKVLCGLLIAISFFTSYVSNADRGGHGFGGHHGGGFHHGGWGYGNGAFIGGLGLGYGLGYGAYNYYPYNYQPYVYPPTVVTVPASPPVYIQQSAPPVAKQYPAGYWYHCSNPEGYYPYVKDCPNGWQQVEPSPANHN